MVKLGLQENILNNDDPLGSEDLVRKNFSSAMINEIITSFYLRLSLVQALEH